MTLGVAVKNPVALTLTEGEGDATAVPVFVGVGVSAGVTGPMAEGDVG